MACSRKLSEFRSDPGFPFPNLNLSTKRLGAVGSKPPLIAQLLYCARNRSQIGAYSEGTRAFAYFFLRSERIAGGLSSSLDAAFSPVTASARSASQIGGELPVKCNVDGSTAGRCNETSHTRSVSNVIQKVPEEETTVLPSGLTIE